MKVKFTVFIQGGITHGRTKKSSFVQFCSCTAYFAVLFVLKITFTPEWSWERGKITHKNSHEFPGQEQRAIFQL